MVNQSMPKMTSRLVEGSRVRSALKIRPSMVRLTPLQMWVLFRSLKGELVMIGFSCGVTGRSYSRANLVDIYEQVALESNRTDVVLPLTRNIPYTTSGAAYTSSASRWLRRPQVADPLN
jgi:hypothetical protein